MKPALRHLLVALLLAFAVSGALMADSGASAGQVQQIVNASDQGWLTKMTSGLFDNMVYALTVWMELGLYLAWLAVSWAVIKLYSGIGTYLIPIWDFSNGLGFFQASESGAFGVVCVPQAASDLLCSMVPWIVSLCGILVFGLAALAVPRSVRDGQEPFEVGGAMAWAAGLMLAFPLLYSAPIHVGNYLGREFYESSHQRYVETSGQGTAGSPPGLFDVLLEGSVFPPSTPGSVTETASTQVTLSQQPVTNSSQLSAAFSDVAKEFGPGGDASVAWATAKQAVMYDLEIQASRFVQVILGVMAIIALVGLLMLKGGQIVALILNYYLGWIACALYVHPATRGVFGAWFKAHLGLCLWGLIWAFLVFIMDVIVVASTGLQGMVARADAPGMFLSVGMFMMPFILFAAIHKFKEVGEFVDALGATGRIAARAGASVHHAFQEGQERIPVGIAQDAGHMSVHGGVARQVQSVGGVFANGMERIALASSKAVAALPGAGPAVSGAVEGGLNAVGKLGQKGAGIAATGIRNINRFHGAPSDYDGLVPEEMLEQARKSPLIDVDRARRA